MAFSDFKYPAVLRELGLSSQSEESLFKDIVPAALSSTFRATLEVSVRLATTAHSEASRSTWIVGPVLGELWGKYHGKINMFAGVEFNADPEAGLTGYCDFLIGRSPQLPYIEAPMIVIFEAKRDSIPDGLGQCVAGMEGVRRFNQREGRPIETVYGCVTTGSLWKFLKLSGTVLTIDLTEYTIAQVDKLLGIFTFMIGPVPEPVAA